MNKYDLRQYCLSEGKPCFNGAATVCELPFMHDGACSHVREDLFSESLSDDLESTFVDEEVA